MCNMLILSLFFAEFGDQYSVPQILDVPPDEPKLGSRDSLLKQDTDLDDKYVNLNCYYFLLMTKF